MSVTAMPAPPIIPTVDYFANPGDLIGPDTKVTVDLDPESPTYGRIYGIVAPRATCLLSGPGADSLETCWTVDDLERDDPNLEFVHQGDAIAIGPDGEQTTVKVAVLSGDLDHSPSWMSADEAQSYLGNTGTQIARVRYHWHPEGLVMSGVVYPSAMESETLAKVLASPVSLEARLFTFSRFIASEGKYRLTGAIMVNQPGLPIRRVGSADIGVHDILFAAGSAYVEDAKPPAKSCGCQTVEASSEGAEPVVEEAPADQPEPAETHDQLVADEADDGELLGSLVATVNDLRQELEAHAKLLAELISKL